MGHQLNAFVANKEVLKLIQEKYSNTRIVILNEDWGMIPLTEELFDEINDFVSSDEVYNAAYLTEHIEEKILGIVGKAGIAYIETDYLGGMGSQFGICWQHRKRMIMPDALSNTINEVLKLLGVQSKENRDEFTTLGLENHRNSDDCS